MRLCNAYQVNTHALVLAVSVSSWAVRAFRLARSAVHVYGAKQGSKCPRNVSGAVWQARCLDHACRLAASVWSYDFVYDACANGQTLKCLTVVDEYTRECLAIDVAGSIRAQRVIEVLSRLVSLRGAPKYLRSDNGPEFVSTQLLQWAVDEKLETVLIEPGKPWQNGTNESFNGKFRDECLSMEWFRNRLEARVVIEDWRRHYNEIRPHSSLNYQTPHEFVGNLTNELTTEARISSPYW